MTQSAERLPAFETADTEDRLASFGLSYDDRDCVSDCCDAYPAGHWHGDPAALLQLLDELAMWRGRG